MLPENGNQVNFVQIPIIRAWFTQLLDIQPRQAAAFRAEFLALDQLMDKFQNYLTPFEQFQGHIPNGTRDLLITHSLAYGATIQLHKNFASRNANSNKKCMAAASAMVMILHRANLSEPVSMDPITGVRATTGLYKFLPVLIPNYRRFGWWCVKS